MTNLADCHVIHTTPRRVRLQVPEKRHNRPYFQSLRDRLSQWEDVERVEVNPATTSIVIYSSDSGRVLEMIEASGHLRLVESAEKSPEPQQQLRHRPLQSLDKRIEQWSGGRYNAARVSVFLVVGASVAFKIARGNRISAAAMILLYGGRAAQQWWLSYSERQSDQPDESAPEGRLLPSPTGR